MTPDPFTQAENTGFVLSLIFGLALGTFIFKQAARLHPPTSPFSIRQITRLVVLLIFSIYLAALCHAVLFSFPTVFLFDSGRERQSALNILSRINWIPFNFLHNPYTDRMAREAMMRNQSAEIIQNILLTVPFGLGLGYFLRPAWKKAAGLALLVGFGTETSQLLLSLLLGRAFRAVDITDIILNTFGALLGLILFSAVTSPAMQKTIRRDLPILIFLAASLLVGIFTFSNFGISWDEPYFYAYGDSIQAAYAPGWDRLDESVYGPSAEDHKYYGPAYLLFGKPAALVVSVLLGQPNPARAWHLVNFFCFLLGVYLLYRLGLRLLSPALATMMAIFFATQPLLWGHGFINPKDIPFMVAFLAAMVAGLDWADDVTRPDGVRPGFQVHSALLFGLAAMALGVASAVRVIGPFAGFLVAVYLAGRLIARRSVSFHSILSLFFYALASILVMLVLWPFLWAHPIERLIEVLNHMSDNPTELAVLFMGQVFHANEMPRRYFPQMIALTFTLPLWPLVAIGLVKTCRDLFFSKNRQEPAGMSGPFFLVLLLWFGLLAAYNTIKVPAMYDGIRHFFFILPPLFLLAGYGLGWIADLAARRLAWPLRGLACLLLLLPGLLGILRLHPYEYTYYNSLAGPTFRVYERDFWLTCYGEALDWVAAHEPETPVYIQREFQLVESYQNHSLQLFDLRITPEKHVAAGSLLLFSTRANLDERSNYRNLPVVERFGRDNADFCLLKRKP